MDADAVYRALLAALIGLTAGKGLTEIVRVSPYGTQIRIGEALQAARCLEGPISGDHLAYADAAFYKFGVKRPNDIIEVCATALLELASAREPRDPTQSPSQLQEFLYRRYKRGIDGREFKYEARYTLEYPRTYDAKIWFGDDDSLVEERDHFKGPLLNMPISEDLIRKSVQFAIECKIESFEIV